MGIRYINLDEIEGFNEDMTIEMIADLLKGKICTLLFGQEGQTSGNWY